MTPHDYLLTIEIGSALMIAVGGFGAGYLTRLLQEEMGLKRGAEPVKKRRSKRAY